MDANTTVPADQARRELPLDFLPEFAGPAEWAAMYRAIGLQVVPSHLPGEGNGSSWKRPVLLKWKDLQDDLVAQETFDGWYGPGGAHARRTNMGVLTGRASGNLMVLDLDIHKTPAAADWWRAILETNNVGNDMETPTQVTGGGGLQLLFRCPAGWNIPTCKTPIGVDVRGQGGFAVLPPSRHESKQDYRWQEGLAPWEVEIDLAPEWLLDVIDDLVETYGGVAGPTGAKAPGIESVLDAFGNVKDGRETVMARHVWHAALEWHRECPILPPRKDWHARGWEAYEDYEQKVTVKEQVPGEEKRDGLERERRGPTVYLSKWRATLRKWETPFFQQEADRPPPVKEENPVLRPPAWAPALTPQLDPETGQKASLLLTASQFGARFKPPDYLIDGIVQRGYLYSLTARTNHGKTAIAMYWMQCIARGVPMHGREVMQGTALFMAGENPQDAMARYFVLAETWGFDPDAAKVRFIDGRISLPERLDEVRAEAAAIDDLVLVIVDTAVAYFPGDNINDNAQQVAYAQLLRQLTALPSRPCVVVNCHPVKNAAQDNLSPMGGSTFVNEVDGNLTLWAEEKQVRLHWQTKHRGAEFEPLMFELQTGTSSRAIDRKGRLMPSVVAKPMSEAAAAAGSEQQETDENRVMRVLGHSPGASWALIAERCGFMTEDRPQRSKVQRVIVRLLADRMVERHRAGKYRLTRKGKKEVGMDDGDD